MHILNLFIILLLMLSAYIFCEEINNRFYHLSTKDGLSQNTVLSIYQDSEGFLWFGTYDGLNCYDGYQFTVFRHDFKDQNSLSNNGVYGIGEDENGILWIGTYGGGLNAYNKKTGQFTHFINNQMDENSLSNNFVIRVYKDKNSNLWIGTIDGVLNKFNHEDNSFIHYVPKKDNPGVKNFGEIWAITEDNLGKLFIGTYGGGLYIYNNEKDYFENIIDLIDDSSFLTDNRILSLYSDNDNSLWIGTVGRGLIQLDLKTYKYKQYEYKKDNNKTPSNNEIRAICEDQNGNLWVGTIDGLNLFHKETGEFYYYKYNPADERSISDNFVWNLLIDTSGLLWIGTGNGINSLCLKNKFHLFQTTQDNKNCLSSNYIRSIYEDVKGYLWVGTVGGGLNKIDRKQNTFTHYLHNPDNKHSLSSDKVQGICEDTEGNLWIGTTTSGLNKLDVKKDIFIHYNEQTSRISSNYITNLHIDKNNNLWIGTRDTGLNKLNLLTNEFTHYPYEEDTKNSLSQKMVRTIYEDNSGVLWIGTEGGLNSFDKQSKLFTRFLHNPDNPNSLSNDCILSIMEDSKGLLWVGTAGGGLNKFDLMNNIWLNYSTDDGLPNDYIYGIIEDSAGNLWLSSNNGLSKFNIQSEEIKNFDIYDNLQGNEFNRLAYFKSNSGEFFFGGTNGLNTFFPDQITDNPFIPSVVITSFQQAGENLEFHFDSIELYWQNNFFEFEFAALNFYQSLKNQYAYKLEGFETDWNYIGTKRFGRYTNLPAGKYTLKIKGSNNDRIWNESGTKLRIIVHPAPWQTIWAYIIYVTVFILILAVSIFYIIKTQKVKVMEIANNQKLNFFNTIVHEIKTPLTLINNYFEKYMKENKPDEKLDVIKRNIDQLNQDIKYFFDIQRFQIGKMIYHHDQICNISAIILNKLELFRATCLRKKITLRTDIIPDLFIQTDPRAIERIIINLFDNAYKYTHANGSITITLYKAWDKTVIFEITDTGIGIPDNEKRSIFKPFYQITNKLSSKGGQGMGLFIVKEIIDELKFTIEVQSKIDKGSRFIIQMNKVSPDSMRKALQPVSSSQSLTDPSTLQLPDNDDPFHILLVEDNIEMLLFLTEELKNNNKITTAQNGIEALEKLKSIGIPDLIISDIMMDHMDGFELLSELQLHNEYRAIAFIFLTAKTSLDDKIKGIDHGAIDFIYKPFTIKELNTKIESIKNYIFYRTELIKYDLIKFFNCDFEKKCIEYDITTQEKRVLEVLLLHPDYTYRQVAEILHIQQTTVNSYMQRMFKRTGIHDRYKLLKNFM